MSNHLDLAETPWRQPTKVPELGVNEVHLWRLPLANAREETDLLSVEEKERFARMYFAKDRAARTTTRTRLRELLAAYTGEHPSAIRLAYADHGKPYLPDFPALGFNVSHAGDWALFAFAYNLDLGCDVEFTDQSFRVEDLVSRFFSRVEIPVILGQKAGDRHAAFYRAWTRKEAIIKAKGEGLSLPLDRFGVSIMPEEAVRVLHTDWAQEEAAQWQLHAFTVAREYPAAVAWRGAQKRLRYFDFGARPQVRAKVEKQGG